MILYRLYYDAIVRFIDGFGRIGLNADAFTRACRRNHLTKISCSMYLKSAFVSDSVALLSVCLRHVL